MDLLPTDGAGTPARWMLVFRRVTDCWWVRLLACGTYKHVRAFAYVPETDTWIFFDVGWGRTTLALARGRAARAMMLDWTRDADVLAMAAPGRFVLPWAFCCTTAVRHLIGLPSGALRPDALYRDCLAHGAEIVHGQAASPADNRAD